MDLGPKLARLMLAAAGVTAAECPDRGCYGWATMTQRNIPRQPPEFNDISSEISNVQSAVIPPFSA
jgi:hypothetical protein